MSVGRWLFSLILLGLALSVLLVSLLRVMPPPTTAFMLQSPVKPVQYHWVPRGKISEHARRAVIAAEDQKFWAHQGFDLDAIEKARAHNEKSRRKRGASTISQQTAKNLFLWSGGGYFRKGIEAGYTILIEALWPKERILEVYLNVAEFGPGIYGVEAAAQTYFHTSASRLSASQSARLAAVLPSPRRWKVTAPGPYVQAREAWILRQMGRHDRSSERHPEPEAPMDVPQSLEADTAEPTLFVRETPQSAPLGGAHAPIEADSDGARPPTSAPISAPPPASATSIQAPSAPTSDPTSAPTSDPAASRPDEHP